MIETLQIEEAVETHGEPKLLVEWSSPWHDFVTSIRPALQRSHARLAGEAPFGLIPLRIMIPSYFLEAFLIFAVILVQVKVAQMRPYVAPRFSSHDVIYYSGDELPRTEDLGGAESGKSGRAGGEESYHRTQTIKIARGGSLVQQVVDAPNLKLPSSRDAVANLLAVRPNPGPPPSEGLRSNRIAPNLDANMVAPAPNVIRDYTRNGVQLNSTVVAPAPSVTRDQTTSAPNFSASLIAPAPSVSRDHPLVAPALGPAIIPPAPHVSRDRASSAPSLNTSIVAPAPSVTRDKARSAPSLAANVIQSAPTAISRELSRSPVQMTTASVVPPPVSAPERAGPRASRLNLPAPSVIAPPPSADLSQTTRGLGAVTGPSQTVVPPPPSQSASGSFMSSLVGRIFGASEVVPPPPSVTANGSRGTSGTNLSANVVQPPPTATEAGGSPRGNRNGMGAMSGPNVVAPPPSTGLAGGTGTRSLADSAAPSVGMPNIVQPPPSISGPGGGSGNTGGGSGSARGTLLANNVVPPPPSVGGGTSAAGSGTGRQGSGLGAPLDAGVGLTPPANGGSGTNAGTVMSTQPGSKVGVPIIGGTGSLAMSPTGGDKAGTGGTGGGSGIGRGEGPGSGMNGTSTGAGKTGTGRGSDPTARGGISMAPGPGGAGNATSGNPPIRGVDISGGSSIVTIPGFGSDPAVNDPANPTRSPKKQRDALGVTVVATATSGGAFEPYKNLLRGEQYTTYIDTSLGTVVMAFADVAASGHPYGGSLTSPQSVRTSLPDGLSRTRLVIACEIDASGNVKNLRVLEAGPADMTAKIVAALRSWKFQPATRSSQPVEVKAILGFNIDTNDRF